MEKHSPTDDAPRSDEQQEHERDAERLMLQQEAEHLAHAKYRADSETGLDGRRVAVPDLAKLGHRRNHNPRVGGSSHSSGICVCAAKLRFFAFFAFWLGGIAPCGAGLPKAPQTHRGLLRPWSTNLGARQVKTPKLLLTDTGLTGPHRRGRSPLLGA